MRKLAFLILAAALVLGLGACSLFNQAPVVVVTYYPESPSQDQTIYIDASQTADPENDDLTFTWTFIDKPVGSAATFDPAAAASTSFYADLSGNYDVRLTVSDGTNDVTAEISLYVTGS